MESVLLLYTHGLPTVMTKHKIFRYIVYRLREKKAVNSQCHEDDANKRPYPQIKKRRRKKVALYWQIVELFYKCERQIARKKDSGGSDVTGKILFRRPFVTLCQRFVLGSPHMMCVNIACVQRLRCCDFI